MRHATTPEEIHDLVNNLNFKQKVERSLELIDDYYQEHGDGLVVANSLGKDSVAVWDLAKRVSPKIRGFVVTTRYKPAATKQFMDELVERYPETRVFKNDVEIPDGLYATDPDRCCDLLKVAADAPGDRGDGRELLGDRPALHRGPHPHRLSRGRGARRGPAQAQPDPASGTSARSGSTSPSTASRSTRCTPRATARWAASPARTSRPAPNERAGRWIGTSKCGGECGIHTRPLKARASGLRRQATDGAGEASCL